MSKVVSIKETTSPLEVPESLTLLQMANRWKVWVRTGAVCVQANEDAEYCSSEIIAFMENDGEVNAYQKADGESGHLYNWTASIEACEDADDRLLEILFQGAWEDE